MHLTWYIYADNNNIYFVSAQSKNIIKANNKNTIRTEHQNYNNNLVGTNIEENSKRFWRYIKSLRKENVSIPTLKTPPHPPATSDKSKAETLQRQFISVFTKSDTNIDKLPQLFPHMPKINFEINGVTKLLQNINPNKASGPDHIPANFLILMCKWN